MRVFLSVNKKHDFIHKDIKWGGECGGKLPYVHFKSLSNTFHVSVSRGCSEETELWQFFTISSIIPSRAELETFWLRLCFGCSSLSWEVNNVRLIGCSQPHTVSAELKLKVHLLLSGPSVCRLRYKFSGLRSLPLKYFWEFLGSFCCIHVVMGRKTTQGWWCEVYISKSKLHCVFNLNAEIISQKAAANKLNPPN